MIKNSRTSPSFYKDVEEKDLPEDHWYKEYLKSLQKYSVQSRDVTEYNQSLHDQISAILNGTKPKYSSMEEAVEDLKERTGLNAFVKNKKAQMMGGIQTIVEPQIFKQIPEMKIFIDNYIADRPGTSIESVIHELMKMEQVRHGLPEKTDVGNDVRQYINSKIVESKRDNLTDSNEVNMNIGKIEPSTDVDNNKPFEFCEPKGQ